MVMVEFSVLIRRPDNYSEFDDSILELIIVPADFSYPDK